MAADAPEAPRLPTRRPGRPWPHVQVAALLVKRGICARRDRKGTLFNLLAPVVLVGLVQLILTIDLRTTGPRIPLDAALYGRPTALVVAGLGGRVDRAGVGDVDARVDNLLAFEALVQSATEDTGLILPSSEVEADAGVDQVAGLRAEVALSDANLEVVNVSEANSSTDVSTFLLDTW